MMREAKGECVESRETSESSSDCTACGDIDRREVHRHGVGVSHGAGDVGHMDRKRSMAGLRRLHPHQLAMRCLGVLGKEATQHMIMGFA